MVIIDRPCFFDDGQDRVFSLVLEKSGNVSVTHRLDGFEASRQRRHRAQAVQLLRDRRQINTCKRVLILLEFHNNLSLKWKMLLASLKIILTKRLRKRMIIQNEQKRTILFTNLEDMQDRGSVDRISLDRISWSKVSNNLGVWPNLFLAFDRNF